MKIVKEENPKICISIFPNGVHSKDSEKVEIPSFVNFTTVEVKDRYVTLEYRLTMNQFSEYDAAISRLHRFKGRERLEHRRVSFAESQHYGPNTGPTGKPIDKNNWYFQGNVEPTEVA